MKVTSSIDNHMHDGGFLLFACNAFDLEICQLCPLFVNINDLYYALNCNTYTNTQQNIDFPAACHRKSHATHQWNSYIFNKLLLTQQLIKTNTTVAQTALIKMENQNRIDFNRLNKRLRALFYCVQCAYRKHSDNIDSMCIGVSVQLRNISKQYYIKCSFCWLAH